VCARGNGYSSILPVKEREREGEGAREHAGEGNGADRRVPPRNERGHRRAELGLVGPKDEVG
jgi:hypothetical protein